VVPGDQHVVRGRERLLHPRPPVHCGEFNLAGGASSTPAVNAALAGAEALYAAYTPTSTLSKAVRAQAIAYARTLADYNEGDIGPGHCPG